MGNRFGRSQLLKRMFSVYPNINIKYSVFNQYLGFMYNTELLTILAHHNSGWGVLISCGVNHVRIGWIRLGLVGLSCIGLGRVRMS